MITTLWNKEREQVDRDGCSLFFVEKWLKGNKVKVKSLREQASVKLVPFALLFGLEREQGKKE